jgi:hypothetical protein
LGVTIQPNDVRKIRFNFHANFYLNSTSKTHSLSFNSFCCFSSFFISMNTLIHAWHQTIFRLQNSLKPLRRVKYLNSFTSPQMRHTFISICRWDFRKSIKHTPR